MAQMMKRREATWIAVVTGEARTRPDDYTLAREK